MAQWYFPQTATPRPQVPSLQQAMSPLSSMVDAMRQDALNRQKMEMAKAQQAEAARRFQMQYEAQQANRANAEAWRQKNFEASRADAKAEQSHRDRVFGLQEKRLNAPAKDPQQVQLYRFSMKQLKEAGQPIVPFDEWARENKKAGAANTTVTVGGTQTKGRTAADKAFGKFYDEFIAQGGFADAQKNLQQLRGAQAAFGKLDPKTGKFVSSGKELTGPITGNIPDWALAFTNPEAIDTREKVEEVVQRNLRIVLGAQFTQKEGERLIARAYNPKLDEKTNFERVSRLVGAINTALRARLAAAQYWEKNGTLTGFKGTKNFTIRDIEEAAGLEPFEATGGATSGRAQSILDKYGIK